MAPDATIALDFALARLTGLIDGMTVYRERIAANLGSLGGLHFSQRVLLALTQAGCSREEAYRLVQANAMAVWGELQAGQPASLPEHLHADARIADYLDGKALDACFDNGFYLRHAREIWRRVQGAERGTATKAREPQKPAKAKPQAVRPAGKALRPLSFKKIHMKQPLAKRRAK